MLAELRVQSADQALTDGTVTHARGGKTGEIFTADAHARYLDAVRRGNVFFAANQAGVATPAGLTASSLNFTLYNPLGSGKNLAIMDLVIAPSAAPAAATVIYLVGNLTPSQAAPVTNTALTVQNALLGAGAKNAGLVYSTTTLAAAPVVLRALSFIDAASNVSAAYFKDEVAGAIVLTPGTYVSVQATTATTIIVSMTWEEVPQ